MVGETYGRPPVPAGTSRNDDCLSQIERGIVLFGGALLHLIVGIKILWGTITPYVTSYLQMFDETITTHRTLHVYTYTFLGQAITMYGGGLLEKRIGARSTALLGTFLISGGTLLASFCTSLSSVVASQAIVGLGIGTAYSAPILCSFRHFTANKALVTGVITTGTGFGPFLFGLIAAAYVNPDNEPTDDAGLFPPNSAIVQRVPSMFVLLSLCYATAGLFGSFLLSEPTESDFMETTSRAKAISNSNSGESAPMLPKKLAGFVVPSSEDLEKIKLDNLESSNDASRLEKGSYGGTASMPAKRTVGGGNTRRHQRYGSRTKFKVTYELTTAEMIRDSLCWLVISGAIGSGVLGFWTAATFKSFGQPYLRDDHFLTAVGSIGCLCSGLSRTLWGTMADCLGTFRTIEIVSYASPIFMILYTLMPENKAAFGFLVCGQFALWGANYCLYPPIAAFLFGEKNMGTNYGFIFFVFGVSSTFLIDICGYTSIQFEVLNLIFAGIGFVGALLNSRLRYLTTDIRDEVIMKHHRATSSIGSIF